MGIATLKKDYDPCITEQPEGTEGWLITRQYATKYKLSTAYVHELRRGGKLTHKACSTTYGEGFLFPDIPLKSHPGYKSKVIKKKKKSEQRRAVAKAHPASARTLEGRKKKLALYLDKFKENAPLDQGFFGGLELKDIVQASNFMFYTTWHNWGLVSRPMPGGKRNEKVYYRSDIVRFLQGNFDNDGGPANRDDRVLEETLGTVDCPNDNYYHYDPKKVYDLSGEGCIQWIYDKKICLLDQRSKKWEPITLLDFQEEFIHRALATKDDGDLKHKIAIACWKRGEGKCYTLNTPHIMFDGTIKKVQDVRVGDLLMGDDSTSRKVLSLARGRDEMYEIIPFKSEPFSVNGAHILSMQFRNVRQWREGGKKKTSATIDHIEISVDDYINSPISFKNKAYLYHVSANWPEKNIDIDPYFLGAWLADGTATETSITTPDKEFIDLIYKTAEDYGLKVRSVRKENSKADTYCISGGPIGGKPHILSVKFKNYNLFSNKHIPLAYKANSRDVRLSLLAGLIDGDGAINRTGYEIVQKSKVLADDIAFLARSLGFQVSLKKCRKGIKSTGFKGDYYRLHINGNCSEIPIRIERKKVPARKINKDILRTRIKEIRPLGVDDYYGFTVDKNNLYLLGDFLVAHNSMCVKLIGLFLFFNLRGQKIVFSGSSKDQADKVLFTELKEIVQKTPELAKMVNHGMEVQEARIILRSGPKSIECELVPVATATGLLTGTTAAFFTELHEQKDSSFFEDLYSSLRGIPNGIALVDTTVADKGHIVHKLWDNFRDGDTMIYFDYNGSKTLANRNPEITKEYLEHQKNLMTPAKFRKYFYNLWDDVNTDTLSSEAIRKFGIAGVRVSGGEIYGQSQEMDNLLSALIVVESERDELVKQKVDATHLMESIKDLESKFILMDHLYSIPATADDVANIEKLFKTSLSVFIGMDRAGMTRKGHDRTVVPCFGIGPLNEITNIVFLLDMFIPLDDSMPILQERIINWKNEFGLIEKITLEKYETKDLARWCEDTDVCNEVAYSEAYPSIPRKREIFVPTWQYMSNGYFKAPTVPYYVDSSGRIHEGFTTNKADIFCEEAGVFIFDEERGVFRAQEKGKGRVGTIKDDTMYGTAWGISGSAGTDLMTSGEMRGTADLYGIDINANQDTIGNYDSFGDYSGNIGDY